MKAVFLIVYHDRALITELNRTMLEDTAPD